LYVLDESSLASTRQINEFLLGLRDQDRVLLVGDVRQHEAVEAGRPYHQLQDAGMRTAYLNEIIRQKDSALKEAVEQLARGEIRALGPGPPNCRWLRNDGGVKGHEMNAGLPHDGAHGSGTRGMSQGQAVGE
jgi:hypothetical protein